MIHQVICISWPPQFIFLRPWVSLVHVPMYIHKRLLHMITHIPPVLPLPYSFFLSDWNLLPNPDIFIEGFLPIIIMDVLGWRLSPDGCTSNFTVLVLFYAYTAAFLTKISLWFPWWLVSVSSFGVTCTPSDIKNPLTSGIKLLKSLWWFPTVILCPMGVTQFWRRTRCKNSLRTDWP